MAILRLVYFRWKGKRKDLSNWHFLGTMDNCRPPVGLLVKSWGMILCGLEATLPKASRLPFGRAGVNYTPAFCFYQANMSLEMSVWLSCCLCTKMDRFKVKWQKMKLLTLRTAPFRWLGLQRCQKWKITGSNLSTNPIPPANPSKWNQYNIKIW